MAVTSTRVISKNFFTLICASWLLLGENTASQGSSSGNTSCSTRLCFLFSQSSLVLTWAAFLFPKKQMRGECTFQTLSFIVLCTFSWTQQVSLWEHWMQCWTRRRKSPHFASCIRPQTPKSTGPSRAVRTVLWEPTKSTKWKRRGKSMGSIFGLILSHHYSFS